MQTSTVMIQIRSFLRKRFFLIELLLVGGCSYLLGLVIANLFASWLATASPTKYRDGKGSLPTQETETGSEHLPARNRFVVAERNIFCSNCSTTVTRPDSQPVLASNVFEKATLLATFVAEDPGSSMATIRLKDPPRIRVVTVGDRLLGAQLTEVEARRVEFRIEDRVRHLELLTLKAPTRHDVRGKRQPVRRPHGNLASIRKVGPNRYVIGRRDVDRFLANPLLTARGMRMIPHMKNGEPIGLKLRSLRSNSIYHQLGLRRGDTIQAVNNQSIISPDKALEVYTKLRGASHFTVSVMRNNKPLTLDYTIR